MNKKLLALAVGAAIAMPVAALAEGPTLYGQLDVSLDNVDNGTNDTWMVQNNSSRLGVKGSAETNVDGLKGIYKAEFGVDADDGASPLTSRDIYVGLNGNFGTVVMGNMDTPTKTVQGKVDQFNDSQADIANYMVGDLRAPNVLAYATPKLGDMVTITVGLWQAEGVAPGTATQTGIAEATSVSAVYDQDGLYVGLGMDMETPVAGGGLAISNAVGTLNDITRLALGYTTDTFEVGFLYQMAEQVNSTNEDTSMLLSGAFRSGDLKIKAQYGQTEGDTGATSNTVTSIGVGADYLVGKSTTVYGLVNSMEDDNNTMESTLISLGIEQKF